MTEFVPVAQVEEIPPGSMKAVMIEGRSIAIYHTAEGFFASDNNCPHRGGPLVEGDLTGTDVVCPWHFWTFSLRTGENDRNSQIRLCRHETKVEGSQLFVRLSQPRNDDQ